MTKMTCPADMPQWGKYAWNEIGVHEIGNNRGPDIERYIKLAHAGQVGDPWCAIFANAMLEKSGLRGTRSASSQSFRYDSKNFIQLNGPALGAIVVFWRVSKSSGLGHVGFYCGERGGLIWTLGGNESDMVQIEFLAKNAATFGLKGYYWPAQVPKPLVKTIQVDAAVPTHTVSVV